MQTTYTMKLFMDLCRKAVHYQNLTKTRKVNIIALLEGAYSNIVATTSLQVQVMLPFKINKERKQGTKER